MDPTNSEPVDNKTTGITTPPPKNDMGADGLQPPFVPDSWPGAFKIYKYSKEAVRLNIVPLVLIFLLNALVGTTFGLILKRGGNLANFVLGGLLTATSVLIYVAAVRGETVSLSKALKNAVPFWLKMLGLEIVLVFTLLLSFLLLIVPFFIVLPRIILAQYYLVDQKMDIMEAIKASWHATKDHTGKVWGIIGANIAMALIALTVIGIPVAVYFLIMYSAAFAVLYIFVSGKQSPAVAPAPPADAPASPSAV